MDTQLTPAGFRALPDAAPLAMPTQSLRVAAAGSRNITSAPRAIGLRRLLVIGGAVLLTGIGTREMYRVLAVNGPTPLAIIMLVLFVALFAWIALSFTSALAGFVSLLASRRTPLLTNAPPATRTALLMPTYNEPPQRVMAGLQAIHESLQATGHGDRFDIFILSDTTHPDIWIEEEAAFLALRQRTGDHTRIFYRHRPKNTARKAGNIADWVTRFGGAYPQFLILDADSVMAGGTLVRLVSAMEAHPDVGLIQTLPIITGGTTLFARMQQFAGRVYGPLIAHGIAWWHGAEGNYWGHNALIRRGGWAVHMLPALGGSFEESPPSLTDLAVRDRRWCQGNLQHAAILPTRGLHWISRLHLLTGIGSYITAPLWLAFLLCGMLISLQARFVTPDYFPAGKSLFPQWPVVDPVRAMWVFIATMGLLLVPKVLGALALLVRPADRRGCGGALGLLASLLLETLIAGLLAPVVMVTQTVDVIAILLGRDSGWNAQRRDDGSTPWRDILRLYRRHTLLGLVMGGIAWAISPFLALWMLPVVLGLALAVPLAMITGQRKAGLGLRRIGLLRIPEEAAPPPELIRAAALQKAGEDSGAGMSIGQLLADPDLLAVHRAMLPLPRRPGIDPLDVPLLVGRAKLEEATNLPEGWAALTPAERIACLSDEPALRRLATLHQDPFTSSTHRAR